MKRAVWGLAASGVVTISASCGSADSEGLDHENPPGTGGAGGSSGASPTDPDASTTGAGGSNGDRVTVCDSDNDCTPQGQLCDRGLGRCVDCTNDGDCDAGFVCRSGSCERFYACSDSRDCVDVPGGLTICDTAVGECVQCVVPQDCEENHDCISRMCVGFTPCNNSLDCDQGDVCDQNVGRCVSCVIDADCDSGLVCRNQICQDPGCVPTGCAARCGVVDDGCGAQIDCGPCGTGGAVGTGGATGAGGTGTGSCAAPDQCLCFQYAGRDYLTCDLPLDHAQAQAYCEAAGFRLLRIDDAAEETFISDLHTSSALTNASYWIGASDSAIEGEWRWSDGEQFWSGDSTGSVVGTRYTNWGANQPAPVDNCAHYIGTAFLVVISEWRAVSCGEARRFVCEDY